MKKLKKIFITGISGLLGSSIARNISKDIDVAGCYLNNDVVFSNKNVHIIKLDLLNYEKSYEEISKFSPDMIIHCIAMTNVDYAETHKEECRALNVKTTENVVKIAESLDAKLVYVSTDSVFDGEKGNYSETDKTNPLNIYAKEKLAGENIVKKYKNSTIIRTNIYGINIQNKKSLFEWVLENLKNSTTFNGFTDIYFTPVLTNRFANTLTKIYELNFKGIVNIGSVDKINKYEFACMVADVFDYDKNLILPITSDGKFNTPRPKDTSLNVKLAEKLGIKLYSVHEDIVELKKLLENDP